MYTGIPLIVFDYLQILNCIRYFYHIYINFVCSLIFYIKILNVFKLSLLQSTKSELKFTVMKSFNSSVGCKNKIYNMANSNDHFVIVEFLLIPWQQFL